MSLIKVHFTANSKWIGVCILSLVLLFGELSAQKKDGGDFPKTLYSEEELEAMKPKEKPPWYDSLRFERNKINSYYMYQNQAINPAFAGIGTKVSAYYSFEAQYPQVKELYQPKHLAMLDWAIGKKKNHALGIVYQRQTSPLGDNNIFRTNTFQLNYAGNIKLYRSHKLRLGFSHGWEMTKLDFYGLTFGDMVDPRYGFVYESQELRFGPSRSYPTFNAGMVYENKFLQFSASCNYLNQPRSGYIGMPFISRQYNFALSGYVPFLKLNMLNPYFLVSTGMGWNEYYNYKPWVINGGFNVFVSKYTYCGVGMGNLRSLRFSAGITAWDRLRIGFDMDVLWDRQEQIQFSPIRTLNVHIRYVSKK